MKHILVVSILYFFLAVQQSFAATGAKATQPEIPFKQKYSAVDAEVRTLLDTLHSEYDKKLALINESKEEKLRLLYENSPNVFERRDEETMLYNDYREQLNDLQKKLGASQAAINKILSEARRQLVFNKAVDATTWQSIINFDATKFVLAPGPVYTAGSGSISLPASSGTSGQSTPSPTPQNTTASSVSTSTPAPAQSTPPASPSGINPELADRLPPQESIGERIVQAELSQDQMRIREQLFRHEQERKRLAEAQALETERQTSGFLGQNASSSPRDCNDQDPSVHPGAQELCNYIDDDCDGTVDEDVSDSSSLQRLVYLDRDGDLHGDPETGTYLCHQTTRDEETGGYMTHYDNDCDDSDPSVWNNCDEVQ